MTEISIASVATQVATEVADKAADLYIQSDNSTKSRGGGLVYVAPFSRTLVFAAINFFILAGIFIGTLVAKLRIQYQPGENYVRDAFVRGIGSALIATGVFVVIDILSGGFATLVMLAVYPLAGVTMLVLSLIAPLFLNDITEIRIVNGTEQRETVSRISAFRLWSVSFWPWFIIGMLVALAFNALLSYLGTKISRVAVDILSNIASPSTGGLNLGSILNNFA